MLTLIGRPKHGGGDSKHKTTAGLPQAAEPSPLLRHLAAEFADEIARLWPAPHTPFVVAEAGRRHLACLCLARASQDAVYPGPAFVLSALDGSLKRAVADLTPDAPIGLARALGRLGEFAWTAADYRLLLILLADPAAGKVLRHASQITPHEVRALGALPTDLAEEGGVLLRLTEDQTRLVAQCHAGLVRRDGAALARAAARRWAVARCPKALFKQVAEDISVDAWEPFHPGTERLHPLSSRAALLEASRRYRNCLDGRDPGPDSHYYEWLGPPGVIVQIDKDPLWGWVLEEGRLPGNETVPAEVQSAIAVDLRAMGVQVGYGRWPLHWRLKRAAQKGFAFADETEQVAMAFGD